MRQITLLSSLLLALFFPSCNDEYDDTDLWNAVNDHEERLAALEAWQAQVNNNIAALQELLNTNDMITSVSPVTMGDETIGYTINFLHSEPITIYNGAKGEQGETGDTPQIGLTQGDDGNWYWTLNGELMCDANGNPIRANGEDGKDGQDGADGEDGEDGAPGTPGRPGADGDDAPTPQISLGSSITAGTIKPDGEEKVNDAWCLSVDDGKTWYRVSGSDGDGFFASVEESEDGLYYTFTLTGGGGSFDVPVYQGVSILLRI